MMRNQNLVTYNSLNVPKFVPLEPRPNWSVCYVLGWVQLQPLRHKLGPGFVALLGNLPPGAAIPGGATNVRNLLAKVLLHE